MGLGSVVSVTTIRESAERDVVGRFRRVSLMTPLLLVVLEKEKKKEAIRTVLFLVVGRFRRVSLISVGLDG